MKDSKAARELAARALVDLAALRELVGNHRVADEIFGFLAQQASEKSLKAWFDSAGLKRGQNRWFGGGPPEWPTL